MSREKTLKLLPYLALAAIAALLVIKQFQLQVLVALSALYLFWGYLEAVAIVLITALWLFAFRKRWLLPLIALVLLLDLSLPAARDYVANRGEPKGPTLDVISFNWLGENEARGPIFEWLAKQSADIVAIQEFSDKEPGALAGLSALFPYHSTPAPDLILLSKYPIIEENIRLVEEHSVVRIVLNVEGRRLAVWGVHPSTLRSSADLAARNYYLTRLAYMLGWNKESIVVLGDFNATIWDPYFDRVKRKGNLHQQAFLLPPASRMGVRTGIPFFGSPIDHILTNRNNVLSGCHTGPALGSDHLPLICQLTLGQ